MKSKNSSFSISNRLKSFKHAFAGLRVLIKEEHNARVHLAASVVVCLLGYFLNISAMEWIVVLFCIMSVITTEIINSSIENLADLVSPGYHILIKKAKDLGALAVLITATISFIIGTIIFLPKLFS